MSLENQGVFQFLKKVIFSKNSDVLQLVARVPFVCD